MKPTSSLPRTTRLAHTSAPRPLHQSSQRMTFSQALTSSPDNTTTPIDLSSTFSLDNVRQSLIRQEDTIIFSLIERAQFAHNPSIYLSDAIPVPAFKSDGSRYSFLEWLLRETEQVHGKIRRYTSPDEQPFFPEDLPSLVLPPIQFPAVLHPCAKSININDQVMKLYLDELLPGITQKGDDYNYGSSAMQDVLCLQALSKRIHYGKFVAEAKFSSRQAEYTPLIQRQDAEGLMQLLLDEAVEAKVVDRVRRKAATYGQDVSSLPSSPNGLQGATTMRVQPDVIADLYARWIMPLTKKVQVLYLLRRLD